jgi:hypothetical protein
VVRRIGIPGGVGAVVLTSLLAMSWGLDPVTILPSLLIGGLIGCAGGYMGMVAFRLKSELPKNDPLSVLFSIFHTTAAGVSGLVGGAILSLLAYWSIWLPFVYHIDWERSYPGYMEGVVVVFNGGLLTAAISLLCATVAVQELLGTRRRNNAGA